MDACRIFMPASPTFSRTSSRAGRRQPRQGPGCLKVTGGNSSQVLKSSVDGCWAEQLITSYPTVHESTGKHWLRALHFTVQTLVPPAPSSNNNALRTGLHSTWTITCLLAGLATALSCNMVHYVPLLLMLWCRSRCASEGRDHHAASAEENQGGIPGELPRLPHPAMNSFVQLHARAHFLMIAFITIGPT